MIELIEEKDMTLTVSSLWTSTVSYGALGNDTASISAYTGLNNYGVIHTDRGINYQ